MPLISKIEILCPDYEPAEPGGKRCRHFRDGLCAHDDHPLCEEKLRRNPGWAPDDPAARAALALPVYRDLVIAGEYFLDKDWRSWGGTFGSRARHDVRESAGSVPKDPKPAASFLHYPCRMARRPRGACRLCGEPIIPWDKYHDGGSGALRAHLRCVEEADPDVPPDPARAMLRLVAAFLERQASRLEPTREDRLLFKIADEIERVAGLDDEELARAVEERVHRSGDQ